jgi:hypothetical protein
MTLRDEPVRLHVGPLYLFFQFTILILSSYPSSSSMSDDHKRICSRPESQGVNGLAGQLTAARLASTFYFLFLRRRTPPTAPANCHQAPPATHGGGPPHAARPRPLPPCAPSSSRQTMVALVDAVVAIAGRVAEAVWDMRSSCLDPPVGGRAAALRRGLQRGHPASAFTRVDRRVRSQPKRKHMIGVDFLVPVKSASIYSTPEETLP